MIGGLVFWIALTIVFGVVEAIARTGHALPFGLAAAASAVAAVIGLSPGTQWGVYALAALVFAFAGRPLLLRLVRVVRRR